MMCMASTVQGDFNKIEAALDRANELAEETTGIENAADLALELAAGIAVSVAIAAAEVQTAGPLAEVELVGLAERDDFMADPFDFSPGYQAWMGGIEPKDGRER